MLRGVPQGNRKLSGCVRNYPGYAAKEGAVAVAVPPAIIRSDVRFMGHRLVERKVIQNYD
jgi:hypothetical protein